MPEDNNNSELVSNLEQRINRIQYMDDAELGTFTRLDWIILVLICLVIPVIAVVAVR